MKDFFEVTEIAENIYQIYESAGVNSTLIVGKCRALLIDTGYGFANIKEVVESITDLPLRVVNTHGHTDHVGGNRFFRRVWMNPSDKDIYTDYQVHQKPLIAARFETLQKALGKPNVWPEDFDRQAWYEGSTEEFCWLINGQTVDLDAEEERCNQSFEFDEPSSENHLIETIFMPGHTGGSVMFFDWKSHLLFAGDDLDYSMWLMFDNSAPLYIYRNNIKELEKYPIKGIVPSHRRKILSPWLLKRLPEAIDHVKIEESRVFYHPRTGAPALLYKEPLNGESPDGMDTIYIVYHRNNM